MISLIIFFKGSFKINKDFEFTKDTEFNLMEVIMAIIITGGTAGLVAAGGNMLLAEGLAGGAIAAETIAAATTAASVTTAATTATVVTSTAVAATGAGGTVGGVIITTAGTIVGGPLFWTLIGVGVLGEENFDQSNSLNKDDMNLLGVHAIDDIL